MSQVIRQNNLFAGEDFRKVYKSFQDIDFTAYDYDTLKSALIDYIRIHYQEDYNDYIESSEFIALIELLAYLGTSLAFRVDLNSKENIMDTAERRQSIIRLAKMVNYQPKRNIAAKGLFKLASIQTNQLLSDSEGTDLNNIPIFWNDPNNPDWFDQFVTILNQAFNSTNPFGRPSKSGTIGGISTDLYQLNNVLGLEVAYNVSLNVNGETIPVDIVNPDFTDGETFFERNPNQDEAFNLIYRNDTFGVGSENTGFFCYFKQGELQNIDNNYEFPTPNRVEDIEIENINNTDVYVQEINDVGEVLEHWKAVPSLSGNNVIFNSLNFSERNIFEVISDVNDTVKIKYSDGNFGNVPTGLIRTWVRQSINRNLTIRPEDARNIRIVIPYIGTDGLEYNLQLTFNLEQTISNSAPSETSEQIKIRAPQTYYTQNRMINNEDYNVFPLTYGNSIAKLQATNRTYAGHSRYIDTNDPTGFHKDLTILGKDGALYKDSDEQRVEIELSTDVLANVGEYVTPLIDSNLDDTSLETFFYNDYLAPNSLPGTLPENAYTPTWKTAPNRFKNDTGVLYDSTYPSITGAIPVNTSAYRFFKQGSIVTFSNGSVSKNALVRSVINAGEPLDDDITVTGPIELSVEIEDGYTATTALPPFRTTLTEDERNDLISELDSLSTFGYGYDLENDEWYIILEADIDYTSAFSLDNAGDVSGTGLDASWLMLVTYYPGDSQTSPYYELITRGTIFIFESVKSVRFYWDSEQQVFDSNTGKSLQDTITILPNINNDYTGTTPLNSASIWQFSNNFIQEDGYQETSRMEVVPVDSDEDGVADNPLEFDRIVDASDYIIFENYVDENNYQRYRPVVSNIIEITDDPTINIDIENKTFGGTSGSDYSITDASLYKVQSQAALDSIVTQLNAGDINGHLGFSGSALEIAQAIEFVDTLSGIEFRVGGLSIGNSNTYQFIDRELNISLDEEAVLGTSTTYFEKNGRSLTQNSLVPEQDTTPFYFKWEHYAPVDQRIDPSVSNIVDMIVLTESYYRDVSIWKEEAKSRSEFPRAPSTEDLRIEYGDLNTYKAVSDQIVFKSGKFKILFGHQADPELQATFKVVKIPTVVVSDNEIKTKVIQAIDEYFDINNWSFGEKFFYTELAAFIHSKMTKLLSSVVIVPTKGSSEFGNLFEIPSNSDELFISTATVANVEIVSGYTEANLRL
jgi:hypothetical protein